MPPSSSWSRRAGSFSGLRSFYHGGPGGVKYTDGVNARRQAVRDQVLRTAADLFRERGYRATTLDHIAARLGMAKPSLYTYFHAKEEMLAAISRQTIETFTRELSLVLDSGLSTEDKLRRVVRDHVRFVIANR